MDSFDGSLRDVFDRDTVGALAYIGFYRPSAGFNNAA